MKRIKDYMNKDFVTFGPHDSLFDVAETFSKKNISGAPVVDGRNVIGMISMSDIMRFMKVKVERSNMLLQEPHSLSMMIAGLIKQEIEFKREVKKMSKSMVKDFMNKDIVSIGPEATLIEAAEIMDQKKINRLPVLEDGKLLGVISRLDMLKAMLD